MISKKSFRFPKIELSQKSMAVLTTVHELMIETCSFNTTPPSNTSSRNVSPDFTNVSSLKQSFRQSSIINVPPIGMNIDKVDELPISKHRQDIVNLYVSNKVLVLEGDAGCGKSTRFPQFILDNCSRNKIPCRILVVTPRGVAAVSSAERVSFERDELLGTTVGFQIKLESKISASSNLIYTSTEYLLAKLVDQEPNEYFKNFTTLIIDELQERNLLTDIVMLCVRERCSLETLKIAILTSSESDKIAEYFDGCSVYKIKSDEKCEGIQIKELFIDDVLKMNNYEEMLTDRKLVQFANEELYNKHLLTKYYRKSFNFCFNPVVPIDLNLISKLVNYLHLNSEKTSTILIFLPTYNEILLLANKLFETSDLNCEIVSLHDEMQSSDVSKVFTKFPTTGRKIVLTTKIAESLFTINNVQYVIDTGSEYVETFEAQTRCSTSKIDWIRKNSAIQRKSRVTSLCNGTIFRLYSRDNFNNLTEIKNWELKRIDTWDSDMTKICLFAKIIAKNETIEDFLFKIFPSPALSLDCQKGHYNISFLQQMGALNVDESITQLGKFLAAIPLKAQHAKMLLYGIFFKCIDPILTIVSILSFQSPFNVPDNDDDRAKIEEIKQQLLDGSYSDIFVMLKIFQNWNEYKSSKTFDCIFCEKNFVGPGTLELISLFRVRLVGHLRSLKIIHSVGSISLLNENSNSWSVIKACITAGNYPNVMIFSDDEFAVKDFRIEQSSVLKMDDLRTMSSNFLVYDKIEKKRKNIGEFVYYKDMISCSLVSNFCVAILAGNVVTFEVEKSSSDSNETQCIIKIDNCLQLNGSVETAKALKYLRERLDDLFKKFLCNVEKFTMTGKECVIHEAIVTMLKIEDQEIGMKAEYKGIGSRPRIVTRDCGDISMNSVSSINNCSMTSNYS
jgi:HrpA-like RNA helicase